jgi:hypothetical protein
VTATANSNTAAIQSEQQARVDGDSANASAITAVQSQTTFNAVTNWTFNGGHNGFTIANGTLYSGGQNLSDLGCLIVNCISPQSNPQLLSASNLAINGLKNYTCRIKLRWRTKTSWNGFMYWANSSHGFSANYAASIPQPPDNNWFIAEINLSGISDWITSTITQVRFDFDTGPSNVDIQWISFGNRNDPGGSATAVQQLTVGTTIGGTAYAAASVMVDANGRIGGTRLASDGTVSSFAVVAD